MFINKQPRIDINNDSITTALEKKAKNTKLSNTTLNKLAKIANSHIGLTKAEAKNVFIKNKPIGNTPYSNKLVSELKNVISHISNPELKDRINDFICNSSSDLMSSAKFVDTYSRSIGQTIGDGGEAIVVEDKRNNGKVLKIFYDDIPRNEITNQAESFEKFYGKNSADILFGRAIRMKEIKGTPLSQITKLPANAATKFMSLISQMEKKGCAPSDMSENNFLYNKAKNKFLPVDISTNKDNKVDENGLTYIINHISNKTVG